MKRTYESARTGSRHTYQFYKDRQNDPRWQEDFILVRKTRRLENALMIVIALIVFTLGIGIFIDFSPSMNSAKNDAKSSAPVTISSKKTTGSTAASQKAPVTSANSHSELSPAQINAMLQKIIIGKGFRITPFLFDGEDTDQAMNEGKAPQNLAHDGIELLYFKSQTVVTLKNVPGYFYPHDENYQILDQKIIIPRLKKMIPFVITENKVSFAYWDTLFSDETGTHTITWKVEDDPQALDLIKDSEIRKKNEDRQAQAAEASRKAEAARQKAADQAAEASRKAEEQAEESSRKAAQASSQAEEQAEESSRKAESASSDANAESDETAP